MRIHRILALAAADIIRSVFERQRVLDRELARAFEAHPKWGKRDRSFVAETVFEVVRWRRALGFLVDNDEPEALCAAQWVRMGFELPEWWEYNGEPAQQILARELELPSQSRAIRESIPDWLDALGEAELGPAWSAELSTLNQRSRVYLRVNTLQATRAAVIQWLSEHNIVAEPVAELPDALVLQPGKTLPKSLRNDGRVEIQDAGSQSIAPLLAAQPGEYVIDSCAGAGGKALHLAALMQNEGRIVGMDIVPAKLQELARRARRAKASKSIQTHPISESTLDDFSASADRLLIDAPCSGLGTLKRQPDLKWRIRPEQLENVRLTQAQLLHSYPQMLKPGGCLVYATCSLLPSENRMAIEPLLNSGAYRLIQECVISPAATGFDGFYAAALLKLPA